jgi:hypothetical protein
VGKKCGIIFQPQQQFNLCADVVAVFRRLRGGRLVVFVQCKELFHNEYDGVHVVANWRWGQQFARCAMVQGHMPWKHHSGVPTRQNPFFGKLCGGNEDTLFAFLLVTVNAIAEDADQLQALLLGQQLQQHLTRMPHSATSYPAGRLAADEGVLDFAWMERWCPTVAHCLIGASKLRSLILRSLGEDYALGDKPSSYRLS